MVIPHKRKYRAFAAILATTIAITCLAGCKDKNQETQGQVPAHIHTFAEQYSFDAANHWHLAT